jgi:hypothetical protein
LIRKEKWKYFFQGVILCEESDFLCVHLHYNELDSEYVESCDCYDPTPSQDKNVTIFQKLIQKICFKYKNGKWKNKKITYTFLRVN